MALDSLLQKMHHKMVDQNSTQLADAGEGDSLDFVQEEIAEVLYEGPEEVEAGDQDVSVNSNSPAQLGKSVLHQGSDKTLGAVIFLVICFALRFHRPDNATGFVTSFVVSLCQHATQ